MSKLAIRKGVRIIPTESESVALDMRSGQYFVLNGSMRDLLEGLASPIPLADLVAFCAARWDIPGARAQEEVQKGLDQLKRNRLLK